MAQMGYELDDERTEGSEHQSPHGACAERLWEFDAQLDRPGRVAVIFMLSSTAPALGC